MTLFCVCICKSHPSGADSAALLRCHGPSCHARVDKTITHKHQITTVLPHPTSRNTPRVPRNRVQRPLFLFCPSPDSCAIHHTIIPAGPLRSNQTSGRVTDPNPARGHTIPSYLETEKSRAAEERPESFSPSLPPPWYFHSCTSQLSLQLQRSAS